MSLCYLRRHSGSDYRVCMLNSSTLLKVGAESHIALYIIKNIPITETIFLGNFNQNVDIQYYLNLWKRHVRDLLVFLIYTAGEY